jgi:hypothetical protein
MFTRPATADEVRQHYRVLGHECRISDDGRVEYRRHGEGPWLDGRWLSEYRVTDEIGLHVS